MAYRSLSMVAGDSVVFSYTLTNADGTPMDLTGASAQWGISPDGLAGSATLTKSVGSGITITDAVGGLLTVTIDKGDIAAGHHWYELEVTLADSSSSTMEQGWLHARSAIYAT